MKIDYDSCKREHTLLMRNIDFARADEVFAGIHYTGEDNRQDYGETRFITIGKLDERTVVMVWTPRHNTRRIISMRKANEREIKKFTQYLD